MQVGRKSTGRKFTDDQIRAFLNDPPSSIMDRFTTRSDREAYWYMRRKLREEKERALEELRRDSEYISYRNRQLERVMNTGAVIMEISRNWNDVSDSHFEKYNIAAIAIMEKMDEIALEDREAIGELPNTYWMKVARTRLKVELKKRLSKKTREVLFCDFGGTGDDHRQVEEFFPLESKSWSGGSEEVGARDYHGERIQEIELGRISLRLSGRYREFFCLVLEGCSWAEAGMEIGFTEGEIDPARRRITSVAKEVIWGIDDSGQLSLF